MQRVSSLKPLGERRFKVELCQRFTVFLSGKAFLFSLAVILERGELIEFAGLLITPPSGSVPIMCQNRRAERFY